MSLFSQNFLPHGHCYFWQPGLLFLHVVSDAVITLAYFSIPFALYSFVRRRSDFIYNHVLTCFGLFILLCGVTHAMSVLTVWHPYYWLDGMLKFATAVVSVITAFLVWPLIPKLLTLPSHRELARTKEELRAEAEKKVHAETSGKLRSQFLANMSHEIRTPLNGITGMLQLVKDTKLSKEQDEYVNYALQSSDLLLNIVNDILDLSKIDAGRMELRVAPFDISESVRSVARLLEPKARQKGLGMKVDIDPSIPSQLFGDQTRVVQILMNLVQNAIKFTETGDLHVGIHREHDAGDRVLVALSVVDTGIGIHESAQEQIFDSFSQADQASTDRFGGTGLGLTISRQLARLMGGTVTVHSTPGEGSTFTAYLWLQTSATHGAPTPERESVSSSKVGTRLNGKRILVVEDNQVNQKVVTRMLEKVGVSVTVASNGIEGLDCFMRDEFDLVFMDVNMPEMNGLDATRKIREFEATTSRYTPIIALSASVLEEDEQICRESGMNAFLQKPFSQSKLVEVVEEYLGLVERGEFESTHLGLND